jgi:hypothetical protein
MRKKGPTKHCSVQRFLSDDAFPTRMTTSPPFCVPSAGWRIREIPDCASSPKTHADAPQVAVKDLEAFFLSQREKIGLAGFLLNGSIGSQ